MKYIPTKEVTMANIIAMVLTLLLQIYCIYLFITGEFSFYEFVTSISLLDIVALLEKKELSK